MKKILLSLIVLSLFPVVKTSNFYSNTKPVSSACLKNIKYAQNSSDDAPEFYPDENGNVTLAGDDGEEITFNVDDELNKELEYYKERWENEPENRERIACLIDALSKDIEAYRDYLTALYGSTALNAPQTASEYDYTNGYAYDVIAAIAFFATTIAVSYCLDGKRIISYANELDTSGGMKVMYNVIG